MVTLLNASQNLLIITWTSCTDTAILHQRHDPLPSPTPESRPAPRKRYPRHASVMFLPYTLTYHIRKAKKLAAIFLTPVHWNLFPLKECATLSERSLKWAISLSMVNTSYRPHSRPQRPRSFWSAPRIATSGQFQRHCSFEWICNHNRSRPEAIRFARLDSEHAQSDGKSVNRGLPLLELARGRDSWCWSKGAWPLGASGDENVQTHGTAMGTRMAPFYANLFMGNFEQLAIENAPVKPFVWWWYIDDIFVIWTEGEHNLKIFINYINSIHPTIKFTHEYSNSSNQSLPFLDVQVHLD